MIPQCGNGSGRNQELMKDHQEFEWMEQLVENAERLDREKATD